MCRGVLQTGLGYFPSRRDFERFQARATPTLVRFACAECGEQCERLWYTGASEPRFCSKPCSSRARSRERDYRERAATTTDAPIDRAAILARDNFVCYLCGSTTDPEDWEPTRGRDGRLYRRIGPRYPTLDHVVALARGGEHAESNLRCACFDCNTRKGAQ